MGNQFVGGIIVGIGLCPILIFAIWSLWDLWQRRGDRWVEARSKILVVSGEITEKRILCITTANGDELQFTGSGTVWKSYPWFTRQETPVERKLCQINEYIKTHGNPWPRAHKQGRDIV